MRLADTSVTKLPQKTYKKLQLCIFQQAKVLSDQRLLYLKNMTHLFKQCKRYKTNSFYPTFKYMLKVTNKNK